MRVLVWLLVAVLGIGPVWAENPSDEVAGGNVDATGVAPGDGDDDAARVAKDDDGGKPEGLEKLTVAQREQVAAAFDEVNDIEPAAGNSADGRVLSDRDVEAYKKLFAAARAGKSVDARNVKSHILMGYVKAAGFIDGKGGDFSALNGWLKDYRDLAPAGEVYRLADAKRERPREVCTTKKVVVKEEKAKGKADKGKADKAKSEKDTKKKAKAKTRTVKTCSMVGKLGPAPVRPLAMELKEEKQAAREAATQARLSKLSAEGRKILATSWRARVRGDFGAALEVLMKDGARDAAGEANWQSELVKVASFYHGKREWKYVLQAAMPASEVKGPNRGEALWLAGFASYRLGQVRNAADYWDDLARNEPAGSPHSARAAWWGARAFTELGQNSRERELLRLGARDRVGFYGQLCAARLGETPRLDWDLPSVGRDDIAKLMKVPAARRALALAQVGEITWAQQEFRMADDDLPYQATRALAILAVKKHLPAVALQAGKELMQRGEILPGALFPVPEQWAPRGGRWQFDRALMTGIMRQESAFQPSIGSWAGAQGLMQLMPATAAFVARMEGHGVPSRSDLHDPSTNLMLAQDYLNHLSEQLEGNLMLVVAAYNGGIGNVKRWLDRGVTPADDPVLWLESIPFDETRDYVEKVFANYWVYQQRMGAKAWSLQSLADGYWPLAWKAAANHDGNNG